MVHADSSPDVPGNILMQHKQKRLKRKIKLYIVQYYDKQSSWLVIPSFSSRLDDPTYCFVGKAFLGTNFNYSARIKVSTFFLFSFSYRMFIPFSTELDEEMLTSKEKQKWKPSASKQQCREAYE